MASNHNVVDLTLDSDSDSGRPAPKRRRLHSAGVRVAPASNDSDDGDVVLVVPVRERPQPRPSAAQDADLGDEDLAIVGDVGTVVTRDFPHPRHSCAAHGFTSAVSTSNATHCAQCFCFVCDIKASECRFWGTGSRERDHANARPLSYWKSLREEARKGNVGLVNSEYRGVGSIPNRLLVVQQPQQARIPFPPVGEKELPTAGAGGGGQAGASSDGQQAPDAAGRAPANLAAMAARSSNPPQPALAAAAAPSPGPAIATPAAAAAPAGQAHAAAEAPSRPCKLRPLPDPSIDRLAIELGVLRFSVKAAAGHTIAGLAARLERFGFYYNSSARTEDWGDRLSLDNLFDSRFGMHDGKYKSKSLHLKMLPLPPPEEEAVPVRTDRVRKVLVIDCLGRTRATVMGVRVPNKGKRADLLAALAPMLRPLFSSMSELLHLVRFNALDGNIVKPVDPNTPLDDVFCDSNLGADDWPHLVVYRTSHHPAPTWPVGGSSSGSHPKWIEMPAYAHGGVPCVPSSTTPYGGPPAWVLVLVRQFTPPPGPEAPASERYSNTTKRLAPPLLVPLRVDHAKGGGSAERELNAALLRGLQSYRTPSTLSGAHAAPSMVLRGNRSYMSDRPSASSGSRWGVQAESVDPYMPGSSIPQLTAVFAHDLPATSYRLNDMCTPVVDPSASPEAMRQSEADIAEAKRREDSQRKRKVLPISCIGELASTSRRAHPEDKVSLANLGSSGGSSWCRTATDIMLVPSSQPCASAREGELVIKVYAWSASAMGRTSLFLAWDDWPSAAKGDDTRFPLSSTMELLTTGVTDPNEQSLLTAAASAAAAASAGGPSTSRGGGGGSAIAPADLQRRAQAERRRARAMVASVKKLRGSAADRVRCINGLLEFMQSGEGPAAQQPPGLTVTLRPYQLQSLAFMVELERLVDTPASAQAGAGGPSTSAGSGATAAEVDPADEPDGGCPGGYRRLFWLPITNSRGQRYWYSPVFERLTLDVPAQPVGGILAEEMGLGKTVEVMALTLANPPPPSVVAGERLPCGRIASRATLVVCAVSLVGQWQAEAQNKTTGSCCIHPYHGQNRIRDPKRLATEFDVVVTTYQTLQSDHAAGTKDPCQQIKWHRIVFDEGHTLRTPGAKLSKTAVELASDRKWLCTGTPINNAIDDLLGQFAAIHMMPQGKKTYFDTRIKYPFLTALRFAGSSSGNPLLYTLRHTMIRHTKAQSLGGEELLQLPDKTETDVPVCLSAREQELYREVHRKAAAAYAKLKALGAAYVTSHLFTVLSMFMPLRRICSGGLLQPEDLVVREHAAVLGGAHAGNAGGTSTTTDAEAVTVPEDISECPICVDTMEQPVVTKCNHWFCRECLTGWINASAHHNCPACRQPVTLASLRRGVVAQPAVTAPQAAGEDEADSKPHDGVPCETKLRVLLAELRAMRQVDPSAKALVFTQFSQTLEWLKPQLIAEGFGHRTITGNMTLKKRTEAIESFQRDPATCVFLLSVRSGAVGINLTAANYVFLLEPCMNPAIEEQAIGRSWRMGQERPVVVKRFFVKGSIEERIMEVAKMRRAASGGGCASGSVGGSGAGPSGSAAPPVAAGGRGRSASGAAAGSLRQDTADLRLNELELMFREPEFPPPGAAGAGAEQ